MVRYRYNAQIEPPAPFVHVTVSHPEREVAIRDLSAQLDSAADITVVPDDIIVRLGLVPLEEMSVAGFNGHVIETPAYLIKLTVRDQPTIS